MTKLQKPLPTGTPQHDIYVPRQRLSLFSWTCRKKWSWAQQEGFNNTRIEEVPQNLATLLPSPEFRQPKTRGFIFDLTNRFSVLVQPTPAEAGFDGRTRPHYLHLTHQEAWQKISSSVGRTSNDLTDSFMRTDSHENKEMTWSARTGRHEGHGQSSIASTTPHYTYSQNLNQDVVDRQIEKVTKCEEAEQDGRRRHDSRQYLGLVREA